MESAPNSLSSALLERRRRRFGQGYVFGPGEFFPIEVEPVLFGGRMRLYVPVLTDDLLTLEVFAARVLRSLQAFGQGFESEEERAAAAKSLLLRFGEPLRAVVLFQALGYQILLNYEIIVRTPGRTLVTFLEEDLRLTSYNAQIAVAARFPTHAFAESLGYQEAFLDVRQAENEAAMSVANSLLIIEREIAFFIIGGEVIRVGAWVVQLVRDARGAQLVVRTLLGFVQRHEAAAALFFILDELFVAIRFLGGKLLTLLMVVGIHDVVLDIMPLLARLEGMVLGCLEAELTARAQGALTLPGWVVDDDPVDQHFARFLIAQQPEGGSNG